MAGVFRSRSPFAAVRLDIAVSVKVGRSYEARRRAKLDLPFDEEKLGNALEVLSRAKCLSEEEVGTLEAKLRELVSTIERDDVSLAISLTVSCPED